MQVCLWSEFLEDFKEGKKKFRKVTFFTHRRLDKAERLTARSKAGIIYSTCDSFWHFYTHLTHRIFSSNHKSLHVTTISSLVSLTQATLMICLFFNFSIATQNFNLIFSAALNTRALCVPKYLLSLTSGETESLGGNYVRFSQQKIFSQHHLLQLFTCPSSSRVNDNNKLTKSLFNIKQFVFRTALFLYDCSEPNVCDVLITLCDVCLKTNLVNHQSDGSKAKALDMFFTRS